MKVKDLAKESPRSGSIASMAMIPFGVLGSRVCTPVKRQ
jgi:hypothetical protein